MGRHSSRRWWGRAAGAVAGAAIAGGSGAGTNYIHNPLLGVSIAGTGALVGFGGGLGWDRRQDRLEAAQRWNAVFSEGPSPEEDERGSPESTWYWLSPWLATVPFETRRQRYVTGVRRWCIDMQPGRVWLMSGPPGSGKTRLAMQVTTAMRKVEAPQWEVGWVRPGQGEAAIEVAAGWDRPVLAVVDDADLREDLDKLITALHRTHTNYPIRLLLIARDFGYWWTVVQQPLPMAVKLAEGRTKLSASVGGETDQRVAAKRAATVFADKIDARVEQVELTGITDGTPLILLHAAALESALRAKDGNGEPVAVTEAVAALLEREHDVWRQHAVDQGLDEYPCISVRTLRDVLVFTMLVGVTTRRDAHELLPLLSDLENATTELIDRLIVWLHLYDRTTGFCARPHLSAVFAEHLACDALVDNPQLAVAVALAANTAEHVSTILTLLARAASHTASGLAAITTLIDTDPRRILPLAIPIALAGYEQIDTAVAEAIDHCDTGWSIAQTLHRELPAARHVLLHTQLAVARSLVANAVTKVDKAYALRILADVSRWAGRFEEAIPAALDSVRLGRELSGADPAAHKETLARALNSLADVLRVAGRYGEAVPIASDAVVLWRELSAADPAAYEVALAYALNSLASALTLAGRIKEAVTAAEDAVTVWQSLAAAEPNGHQSGLAAALGSLGEALKDAGQHEEAATAAMDNILLRRRLAAENPTVHKQYLAQALGAHAVSLSSAGRNEEAVAAATEAVALWREFAAVDPTFHQHYLAQALNILADVLRLVGRHGEAAIAIKDAVTLYRRLAATDPSAHRSARAEALGSFAISLSITGKHEEAVGAAAEAVNLGKELVAEDPIAETNRLAAALTKLAFTLSRAGRRAEAVAVAVDAVALYQDHPEFGDDNLRIAQQIIRAGAA